MGIYIIDENSNALIDLSISGNETSISNGDAVLGQYVSGATEANGEITYTRSPLPPGTVSGATDTTFTALANNDIIQQKSGVLVNRTPAQLSVDLLSSVGNGILTNTNGVWGITSLPDPIQTGVNPNDTDFRIPVRNTAGGFDDSSLLERKDQLQSFDAIIHHDQGGRDFNIYPTGILADFITNPANYDFSVVTSSTTNGREGFTEEIFNADITRFNTTVQIVNVAVAVAFTQAQIVTIRVGTSVPVATGVANITGLQTWSTGTSNVIFTFDTVGNAQAAVSAFSQTQARLTVTSTVTTIPVAAYNANGEGMLGAFLDGRLAEGDKVRFSQRAGTTQLLTRLNADADVVTIDNHLIVDGPTNLNGTVSFGSKITVPEPTDRADAARYLDTWRTAISDSGIRGTTTTQDAGGRTGISVTSLTGVENAGPHANWWIWTGVDLNDAEDGFGIAVENVVYSTSGTDPFATGTSTANRPINIQATADQSFHRDVDIANDLIVRGDSTVSGDLTISGDTSTAGLTISGNASITGSLTVAEPTNMNHSARWKDSFAGSIHSTGQRGSTTSTVTVGDNTGIVVTPYTEVEGTTTNDWYHYSDVEIGSAITGGEPVLTTSVLTLITADSRSNTVYFNTSVAGRDRFLLRSSTSSAVTPSEWSDVAFLDASASSGAAGNDKLVVIDINNFAHYTVSSTTTLINTSGGVTSAYTATLVSSRGSITGNLGLVYFDPVSTAVDFSIGATDAAQTSATDFSYAYFRDNNNTLVLSILAQQPTSTFTFYDTDGLNPYDLTVVAGSTTALGAASATIALDSTQETAIKALGTLVNNAAFGSIYTFTNAQVEAVLGTVPFRNIGSTDSTIDDAVGNEPTTVVQVLVPITGKGIFSTSATDPLATSAITVPAFTDIGFPGDVSVADNVSVDGGLTVGGDVTATGNLNDFPVTALEKASLFLGTRGTDTTATLTVGGTSTTVDVSPFTTGTNTRHFYNGIAFNSSNALIVGDGIWSTSATAPTITNSINLIG